MLSICPVCGFLFDVTKKGQVYCSQACAKKRRAESAKEANRKYREAHTERIKLYRRENYKRNRDEILRKQREKQREKARLAKEEKRIESERSGGSNKAR